MIPFIVNENRFSFLAAEHQLVGQLCTNTKSDRSLLSCLKVTQCSTSEIGDAPLYDSRSLPIQVMTTEPLPAPSKCKCGRFSTWGHSSTHRTTLWMPTVMVFGVVSSEGHIKDHNRSRPKGRPLLWAVPSSVEPSGFAFWACWQWSCCHGSVESMSCTAAHLRYRSLNIVSLSDMIEGSYRSWDLCTTGQLVDGLQQKKKTGLH